MAANEKWITKSEELTKSGFQGVRVVSGNVVAISKGVDDKGAKIATLKLAPASIEEAEDATMVGPRDDFEIRYYYSPKAGTTWEVVMDAYTKLEIPFVDEGDMFTGPTGHFLRLERITIKLPGTTKARDDEGNEVVGDDGKPVKVARKGTAFIPIEVGEAAEAEISEELKATLVALAQKAKTPDAFKRAALLNKEVVAAGLKEAAASGELYKRVTTGEPY